MGCSWLGAAQGVHQPGPPRGHRGPLCAAWPSGSVISQGDTLSAYPVPATILPAHPPKGEPRPGRHPVTLQCTNPDPMPHLTSPCWERMEHSSTLFTATPLGCRGKQAANKCWLGGLQSSAGQGALEQVRMLPELPSFVSPTANILLFPPASGFRGENAHRSSTSWDQCDGDVLAMAACPNPWCGFPQDRG